MATTTRLVWHSSGHGLTKNDRRACSYEAYIPDRLESRPITFESGVVATIADAESAVRRLDARASALVNTEALARLLLRAESVASSQIEGLVVGGRRLLRSQAAKSLGETQVDVTAAEVLGNIDAMSLALDSVRPGDAITVDHILSAHARLLGGTRLSMHAGRVRDQQNWIGGSQSNPCSAAFVPPPPELVPDLLEDLVAFCNGDTLPAVAQAGIAHAQFETIHPFADGNGRIGRALIHMVMRRRGLTTRVLPPVSLVLATWARDYVRGLSATRYAGDPSSDAARAAMNEWTEIFASATVRAVADAEAFEAKVDDLEKEWRQRLVRTRANSATDLLLRHLPGAPIVTVDGAAKLINRSFQAANEAVRRLVEADILVNIKIGRRNRAFEAHEVIDVFADLERQLASPGGDTVQSPPQRNVPARRQSRP